MRAVREAVAGCCGVVVQDDLCETLVQGNNANTLVKTIQAASTAHTRYLSSPAAATLQGKNARFCAPEVANNYAAIPPRSATTDPKRPLN